MQENFEFTQKTAGRVRAPYEAGAAGERGAGTERAGELHGNARRGVDEAGLFPAVPQLSSVLCLEHPSKISISPACFV